MITVREATSQDTATIVQLIVDLAAMIGERTSLSEAYVEEYLQFPGSKALLGEVDGQVAGLISYTLHPNLYHAGETCLIEELVVCQEARGQGVGRCIFLTAETLRAQRRAPGSPRSPWWIGLFALGQ